MTIYNIDNPSVELIGNLMDEETLEFFFPFFKLLLILTIAMNKPLKVGNNLKKISEKIFIFMGENLNNLNCFA